MMFPKGGILSNLLFLIVINDINKVLQFTYRLLYAENTIIVTGQNLRFISIKIKQMIKGPYING